MAVENIGISAAEDRYRQKLCRELVHKHHSAELEKVNRMMESGEHDRQGLRALAKERQILIAILSSEGNYLASDEELELAP